MARHPPGERTHLATVGIGANLGDRRDTIARAIETLAEGRPDRLVSCSSLYETEPFGKTDQGWFLNCVVQVSTGLDPHAFLRWLLEIEARLGRVREERWGPRTIDLDLLLFDEVACTDRELTLPHPGIPHRRFVLEPLVEVAPDLVVPGLGVTVETLLERLRDPSRVVRLQPPLAAPKA